MSVYDTTMVTVSVNISSDTIVSVNDTTVSVNDTVVIAVSVNDISDTTVLTIPLC